MECAYNWIYRDIKYSTASNSYYFLASCGSNVIFRVQENSSQWEMMKPDFNIVRIYPHPKKPNVIFAIARGVGIANYFYLYKSNDGGNSWKQFMFNAKFQWKNVYDESAPGGVRKERVYLDKGESVMGFYIRQKDGVYFVGTEGTLNYHVFYSKDGGATWSKPVNVKR